MIIFLTNSKEIRLQSEWGRVRIVKGNQDIGIDLCFRPGACISSDYTLKKISVMHVIKLSFAPVSFPPG